MAAAAAPAVSGAVRWLARFVRFLEKEFAQHVDGAHRDDGGGDDELHGFLMHGAASSYSPHASAMRYTRKVNAYEATNSAAVMAAVVRRELTSRRMVAMVAMHMGARMYQARNDRATASPHLSCSTGMRADCSASSPCHLARRQPRDERDADFPAKAQRRKQRLHQVPQPPAEAVFNRRARCAFGCGGKAHQRPQHHAHGKDDGAGAFQKGAHPLPEAARQMPPVGPAPGGQFHEQRKLLDVALAACRQFQQPGGKRRKCDTRRIQPQQHQPLQAKQAQHMGSRAEQVSMGVMAMVTRRSRGS